MLGAGGAYRPFVLKAGCKIHTLSPVQQQAEDALIATDDSGIVVLPCGGGKTALFVRAALRTPGLVLFLSINALGVERIVEEIQENTSVGGTNLCVYTSERRDKYNDLHCFFCTTYTMFANNKDGRRAESTNAVRKFVKQTQWDLIVFDEVQHAPADTFRPLVQELKAKRKLGFTGTLVRMHMSASEEQAVRSGSRSRTDAMEDHFRFVGRILFRRKCAELEREGHIARVRLQRIATPMTPAFAVAHAESAGTTKKYAGSLHPNKLMATWMLANMHVRLGHTVVIFVEYHLHANVLHELFDRDRWGVLSGAVVDDTATTQTTAQNQQVLEAFNARRLDGIISTPIGDTGLNMDHEDFRCVIVFSAHGGGAGALQRLGRVNRIAAWHKPAAGAEGTGDAGDAARAERLRTQKEAYYYEVVTPDTEEEGAADRRAAQFEDDGYAVHRVTLDQLQLALGGLDMPACPCASPEAHEGLLYTVLTQDGRNQAESEGRRAGRAHVKAHTNLVKAKESKAKATNNPLFRSRALKAAGALKKQRTAVKAEAKERRTSAIEQTQVDDATARVLARAGIGPERQAELAALCIDQEIEQEGGSSDSDVPSSGAGDAHT